MRTNEWLEQIMYQLWEDHFNDIPRLNKVVIKFGKRSRLQLGCIKWLDRHTSVIDKILDRLAKSDKTRVTLITITGHFRDENIPEYVVIGTIAHEMCHYAHGFSSPLNQRFRHPHKGGIVTKELKSRNLHEDYKKARKWLKLNWRTYLKSVFH